MWLWEWEDRSFVKFKLLQFIEKERDIFFKLVFFFFRQEAKIYLYVPAQCELE